MAVTYLPTKAGVGGFVLLLSGDTKPSGQTYLRLLETDTGKDYFWNGAAWVLYTPAGGGNVSGPGASTNLAIATWSGTGGTALLDNPNATLTGNTSQYLDRSGNFSVPAGSGNGTVTSVVTGAGLTGGPITTTGTIANLTPFEPGGRLTLTSATPVLTSDVTAATTVYYALYKHAWIPIWDGSKTVPTLIAELSQTTTDTTKSPAACTTNSNYDVFVWNDSGTIRATRGPLWTSDTARGSGAGTTQISRNADGYFTNTVAITNGPGAGLGTYVGTFRTNGSSKVDFIMGGTGAAGGESTILGVWNYYNRVWIRLTNYDNTDSWNYTLAAWRIKNGNNNNKISYVIGFAEEAIEAWNHIGCSNGATNHQSEISIGLDSTSAYAGLASNVCLQTQNAAGAVQDLASGFLAQATLGFHYIAPLEASTASNTTTWYGDNGANGTFTGLNPNAIFYACTNA